MALPDGAGKRGRRPRLGARADPVVACLLGWVLSAAVTAVRLQLTDPAWRGTAPALHLAVAVGHLLGAGAVAAALVWLYDLRRARTRWEARAWVVLLGAPVLYVVLADDMGGLAQRLGDVVPRSVTLGASALAAALLLALAVEVGSRLRGRWGRRIAVAAAAIATWIEPDLFRGLYPGLHGLLVAMAASFAGAALSGAMLPRALGRRPRRLAAALAALGLAAYAVPVSPLVHFLVVRDGDVVAQLAGELLAHAETPLPAACEEAARSSPWLAPRDGLPDASPVDLDRLGPRPIVVLLTVDCLRYDMVGGTPPRASLPALARLRAEGALFSAAQAPGSSTVYTLTSIFSGKYYSQIEWSGPRAAIFPWNDASVHFPALLTDAGVWTVHVPSFDWLDEAHGVVRGFEVADYRSLAGPRWKPAESIGRALVRRLGQVGDRSAFLYAHFNDAHLPYDRGGTQGTPFERYTRELQLVDAQIGAVLEAIDRLGLASRTLVIVTADHGEAFGEHGRTAHGTTLYQELTHVPLLVRGPGIRAGRTIRAPVSLVDLGPTILDAFDLATPPSFMGESLEPALAGRPFASTRPILAQAGHLRSIVTPEGLEVIRDVRRGTVEAYDVRRDPRELANLVGAERADVAAALRTLDCFFAAHQLRRPGYVEPFR